jgi:hypothetical protein
MAKGGVVKYGDVSQRVGVELRDGKSIPSGHFRRGTPGNAPYSKNRGFYNP